MAYLISEEAKDLLQDVHEFCENEVKEQCKAYDVSGEWPKEIYDKAIEMVCLRVWIYHLLWSFPPISLISEIIDQDYQELMLQH